MSGEQWRPIPGADGYEVSDQGRVRSYKLNQSASRTTPKVLAQRLTRQRHPNRARYLHIGLMVDGRRRERLVHQLVLEAFVGPRPDGWVTRHLNDISTDNRLTNLAYGSVAENAQDAIRNGHNGWANRTHCRNGHEFTAENTRRLPSRPGRTCIACLNAKQARQTEHRRQGRAA